MLHSDRGGEYTCTKEQDYLKKQGIEFQCTVAHAPQQNGIAERKNRSLVETARTMLDDAKVPKCWGAEAANTANYIQNRVVSQATSGIPYEMMFGETPKFEDLHKFGEDMFMKIPDAKRKKLDDKALKVKFLGYDQASKGYRLANIKYS